MEEAEKKDVTHTVKKCISKFTGFSYEKNSVLILAL